MMFKAYLAKQIYIKIIALASIALFINAILSPDAGLCLQRPLVSDSGVMARIAQIDAHGKSYRVSVAMQNITLKFSKDLLIKLFGSSEPSPYEVFTYIFNIIQLVGQDKFGQFRHAVIYLDLSEAQGALFGNETLRGSGYIYINKKLFEKSDARRLVRDIITKVIILQGLHYEAGLTDQALLAVEAVTLIKNMPYARSILNDIANFTENAGADNNFTLLLRLVTKISLFSEIYKQSLPMREDPEFSSNVHLLMHDILTPMNGILGFSDLVMAELPSDIPDIAGYRDFSRGLLSFYKVFKELHDALGRMVYANRLDTTHKEELLGLFADYIISLKDSSIFRADIYDRLKGPSLEECQRLARYFRISVQEFISGAINYKNRQAMKSILNRYVLRFERLPIAEMVKEIETKNIPLDKLRFKNPQAKVSFIVDDDFPELIEVDRCTFESVLINLIGNALSFTKSKQEPAITIRCGRADDPGNVKITVVDNGKGIPENRIGSIFDEGRSFREAGEEAVGGAGTGMGLYVCKQVVEKHHGTIAVESQLGAGTKFTIILPIAQPVMQAERFIEGAASDCLASEEAISKP